MSNNTINSKAIDSLKNILITSSQYNFEKEFIDENNVEQYVQAYYNDLEFNESSRLNLKNFVNKFAQKLNIDLNNSRVAVQFSTIDSTFDSSSLDGLIESVNKKIEFIEDMSYTMQNSNDKSAEKEKTFVDNDNNLSTERKSFNYIKKGFDYGKEITDSIKNFLNKQKHKVETFLPNKVKIKEIGNKVLEKIGIKQKELDVSDKATLFIEHLLKIRELREAGVEIDEDIVNKINDPNFDSELIIKKFLENPEPEKIKSENASIKNENTKEVEINEKIKEEESKNKDITIIPEDDIRIYKKESDGKCFSAINYNGNPWGKYKEIPVEEYNKIVENSIAKEYDKMSNVVKNAKGDIIGISETFTLYSEDLEGNKINGITYSKDINGNYTVGLDYKGTQWGPRKLSQEEYNKALSEHLSLTNEASADYLKDANLEDLVHKLNKEQIEKEELAKAEVQREKVVKEDIVKEEVVNDEHEIQNPNSEEKKNTFDCYSVDSFTVKQGKTMHKYFKNEKGEMFKIFVFNDLEGAPKPIEDTLDWENAIKESVEYSKEFADIEIQAKEIDEKSIEVESKEQNKENLDYEDYLGV